MCEQDLPALEFHKEQGLYPIYITLYYIYITITFTLQLLHFALHHSFQYWVFLTLTSKLILVSDWLRIKQSLTFFFFAVFYAVLLVGLKKIFDFSRLWKTEGKKKKLARNKLAPLSMQC